MRNPPKILETILLVFPVRGHSFFSADRVFGKIETITRKKKKTVNKKDSWNKFEKVGKLWILEQHWKSYDLKLLNESVKKVKDAKKIYTN